jgi:hypothetical protein
MHRSRQPRCERLTKAFEPRRREREQARAVVRPVEGNDPRLAGRKQRRAQRDLDRVLAGDAELGRPRQCVAEPLRDFRLGQVAERVHDGRFGDRCRDLRIAVP